MRKRLVFAFLLTKINVWKEATVNINLTIFVFCSSLSYSVIFSNAPVNVQPHAGRATRQAFYVFVEARGKLAESSSHG